MAIIWCEPGGSGQSALFDGVIVQIHQKQGTAVDGSLPVVTLVSHDTVEVEKYVATDRFGSLRNGSTVKFSAGAPVNSELSAEVCFVSPVIDSASDRFRQRYPFAVFHGTTTRPPEVLWASRWF